jgi:hypothetical protein
MFVSCECCLLLSGRGLCDESIPRPAESYRLWCVSQCVSQGNYNLDTETGNRIGRRGRLKKTDTLTCGLCGFSNLQATLLRNCK